MLELVQVHTFRGPAHILQGLSLVVHEREFAYGGADKAIADGKLDESFGDGGRVLTSISSEEYSSSDDQALADAPVVVQQVAEVVDVQTNLPGMAPPADALAVLAMHRFSRLFWPSIREKVECPEWHEDKP